MAKPPEVPKLPLQADTPPVRIEGRSSPVSRLSQEKSPVPPRASHLLKIIVIGDVGVGKTSIIKQYVHRQFSDKYKATIGVDFALKTLEFENPDNPNEKKLVYLQLWDLAGQERVQHLMRLYYEGAAGVLIVCDVTAQHTLDSVESWFRSLSEFMVQKRVPIFLLVNKCDLVCPELKPDSIPKVVETLPKVEATIKRYLDEQYIDRVYQVSARLGIGINRAGLDMASVLIEAHSRAKNPQKLLLGTQSDKEEKGCAC